LFHQERGLVVMLDVGQFDSPRSGRQRYVNDEESLDRSHQYLPISAHSLLKAECVVVDGPFLMRNVSERQMIIFLHE
jgi:hypothetical protein